MATPKITDTELESTSGAESDLNSDGKPERKAAWKLDLTDKIVKGLRLNLPPLEYDKSARLVFAAEHVAKANHT